MDMRAIYGAVFLTLYMQICSMERVLEPDVIYRWNYMDYDWPDPEMRKQFIANGSYIQDNVRLGNVRVFNGSVYVTVPRLRMGVPSTLNLIVDKNSTDSPLLQPFPSWEMHRGTTCNHFRFVSAFEIDPNTGRMWIVDTGYYPNDNVRPETEVKCPSKLVIYDLNNNVIIHEHVFPGIVVGYGKFFLSNIVLDFVDHEVTHAYITDTYDWKLIVYDHSLNYSYTFAHPSMDPERGFVNITLSNRTETIQSFGINGLAMSPEFQYLYYSVVAGVRMFRIPTSVLRDFKHDSIDFTYSTEKVGNKISPGDGLCCTRKNNLFFTTLQGVYQWPLQNIANAILPFPSNITYAAQILVTKDSRLEWVSSPTIDENKNIWFTSRPLGPITGSEERDRWNYFVWRTFVGEKSYMDFSADPKGLVQGAMIRLPSLMIVLISCVLGIIIPLTMR